MSNPGFSDETDIDSITLVESIENRYLLDDSYSSSQSIAEEIDNDLKNSIINDIKIVGWNKASSKNSSISLKDLHKLDSANTHSQYNSDFYIRSYGSASYGLDETERSSGDSVEIPAFPRDESLAIAKGQPRGLDNIKGTGEIIGTMPGVRGSDIRGGVTSILIDTSNFPVLLISRYLLSIVTGDIPTILAEAFQELPTMHVVYNVPLHMKVGKKKIVDVRVTDKIIEDLQDNLKQSNEVLLGTKNVHLNPKSVEIKLLVEPDEFKVYSIRSGKQSIVSNALTAWAWQVTPLRTGSNILWIEASADFYVPSLEESFSQKLDIFKTEITVERNLSLLAKNFLTGSWKELLILTTALKFASLYITEGETLKNMAKDSIRNIYMGSGNYVEGNSGIYAQGDYLNMSQDLPKAAEEIQKLLEKLQAQGVEINDAKDLIATDIAVKAQDDDEIKAKLMTWGASLGNATVTDVVKGIVKLAIRSAGLPLP